MANEHIPVLYTECLDGLAIKSNGVYLDGTFGRGGHSAGILQQLGKDGRLYATDKDPEALAWAAEKFVNEPRLHIVHGSFAQADELLSDVMSNGIDGCLLDLGVSSPQLDDASRGFSFMNDGPLDLRMDPTSGHSAADWLATASLDDISEVIRDYGEEKFHWRIAKHITDAREEGELMKTTLELAKLVSVAVPKHEPHKHPATRTFQAIRIYLNRELDDLEQGLKVMVNALKPGGRLAVISFHSLEDRIVKRFMRDLARPPIDHRSPVPLPSEQATVRLIGKAQKADQQEVADNVRSRSAVLRVLEKI